MQIACRNVTCALRDVKVDLPHTTPNCIICGTPFPRVDVERLLGDLFGGNPFGA